MIAGADGDFSLTPVFDLTITATSGKHSRLAMPFGKEGALMSRDNLVSDCTTYGYSQVDAEALLYWQWEHLQKHALGRLIQLGCDEARALRTVKLMPGRHLFA